MDPGDDAVVGGDFFGVIRGVLRPVPVTAEPLRIDDQRHVFIRVQQPFDDLGCKENVRVAAEERLVHQIFSVEQRGKNIVALPTLIMAKRELRVAFADLVDLVSADEANIVNAAKVESVKRPVENAPAADLGETFGRVCRGRHEPFPSAGSDNDGSHCVSRQPVRAQLGPRSRATR